MNTWIQEKIKENIAKMGQKYEKYNHPGIYAISLDGKIVYIGKSENMAIRIANHMIHIEHLIEKGNKYQVLHQARKEGYMICFSVLCYCSVDELAYKEAKYIREYMPPLNYQIPKLDNPKSYEVNKKASTITLWEILGKEGYQFV